MSDSFPSSEEYDERAHALYNEGRYDEALDLLREGVGRFPESVELHVGIGYARLAREEYAWARAAFDEALRLDPEHEDALAGFGEVALKLGRVDEAMLAFDRTVELGYEDDTDLMLQVGRALFREGYIEGALAFFERAVQHAADHAEAVACVGYAQHRLGHDAAAVEALRRALRLDDGFGEARVYLANLLYDAGELDASLAEFARTAPEDHWDELGIWRFLELQKAAAGLADDDPSLAPWQARLAELDADLDPVDELLAEVETAFMEREAASADEQQGQLEMLGSLLNGLARDRDHEPADNEALALDASPRAAPRDLAADAAHRVIMRDGRTYEGSWEEIVCALRDADDAGRPLEEFMAVAARRHYGATGVRISTRGPEEFLRGSEHAGVLRIVR
jgi:Tfp pilus assembly protein PilF